MWLRMQFEWLRSIPTSFKSLLGQCGVVKGLQKGGNVDIAFDNYKQHGLAPKRLPAFLVEHKGAPVHAQDLQTMVRKPRWIKKQLLQAAEVQDPLWSVLTTVEKGCQASEDQLDLFHACVSWSLGLEGQKQIKVVPAMLAARMISDYDQVEYHEHEDLPALEIRQKMQELVRLWFQVFEVLLIPVYCKAGKDLCQHWTLLSLCTKDGLTHILSPCMAFKDVRIEEAVNKAKQEAVECGWFVCHYMEELLRCSAGQPKQSQGWPNMNRLSKLQAYLKIMVESLEAEREKWCKEVEADNVKIEKFEKDMH